MTRIIVMPLLTISTIKKMSVLPKALKDCIFALLTTWIANGIHKIWTIIIEKAHLSVSKEIIIELADAAMPAIMGKIIALVIEIIFLDLLKMNMIKRMDSIENRIKDKRIQNDRENVKKREEGKARKAQEGTQA